MQKAIPEQSPLYIGFAHASAAIEHKASHGGWLFIPDNAAGAVWFDGATFTAGAVMRHHAAKGNGRLI
jgi:hypothetical protein